MTEIAKYYGVRAAHIAKACDQHDIPRPPNGYWQKLDHGKASKQPSLTTGKFSGEHAVTIRKADRQRIIV